MPEPKPDTTTLPPERDPHRRRRLLDAAERLLQHYGPAKTTVADIAREAGVGVGSVYLEFESKEAIIEELSSSRHASVLREMREASAGPGAPFGERLRRALDARVTAFLRHGEAGLHGPDLFHCVCPGVMEAHRRFLDEERQLLMDLLERAARAEEFAVGDVERTARALQRAYATFSPPWLFRQPPEALKPLLAALHELVLHGLVRRVTPVREPG